MIHRSKAVGAVMAILLSLGTAVTMPVTASAQSEAVDPDATAAGQRMRAYLRTLQSFEVRAEGTMEVPLDDGSKIQVSNRVRYEYRSPDHLFAEWQSDRQLRRLYYDGSKITLAAPVVQYYATIERTGSVAQLLEQLSEEYGVVFPLPDLILWARSDEQAQGVMSSSYIGYATVEGVPADQYLYRQEDVDWQVWIARGDQPMPLKIVITDRSDPAMPSYSAVLKWNVNPTFTDDHFVYAPASGDTRIELVAITGVQ